MTRDGIKVETRLDGTLAIREDMPLLRWGSLASGVLLAATLIAVQQPPGSLEPGAFLGGWLVSVLALSCAAFIPDRTFQFESATGQLHWSVKRLAYTRSGTVPFADVLEVRVQTSVERESSNRPTLSHRLLLVLRGGYLPLSSRMSFDRNVCEKLAGDIRRHMGRPEPAPAETLERAA